MPWESIGSCGNGQLPNDRDWIVQSQELAILYLRFIVGEPPEGCQLGIIWHEHELGEYPTVGVQWTEPQLDRPWRYIQNCETVLEKFDEAVNWSELDPDLVEEDLIEEGDENEV